MLNVLSAVATNFVTDSLTTLATVDNLDAVSNFIAIWTDIGYELYAWMHFIKYGFFCGVGMYFLILIVSAIEDAIIKYRKKVK